VRVRHHCTQDRQDGKERNGVKEVGVRQTTPCGLVFRFMSRKKHDHRGYEANGDSQEPGGCPVGIIVRNMSGRGVPRVWKGKYRMTGMHGLGFR
jgi:hypothetical protein